MSYPIKQELENKRWYRLVKVGFIIFSIFLILASIIISIWAYSDISPQKIHDYWKIKCDSGKELKIEDVIGKNTFIVAPIDVYRINNKCEGIDDFVPYNIKSYPTKKYEIEGVYHTEGNYIKSISFVLLIFIILIGISAFIIWITHKTMLYIIYGRKK